METIGKIRRRRLVQGESISSIARELGVSRNTVKRALKVEGDAYEYRRTRQPMPKLGPFTALLDSSIALRRSPKPGAFMATTFTMPRIVFTTSVASASPSTCSAPNPSASR